MSQDDGCANLFFGAVDFVVRLEEGAEGAVDSELGTMNSFVQLP
jgi:hypothetical protein